VDNDEDGGPMLLFRGPAHADTSIEAAAIKAM